MALWNEVSQQVSGFQPKLCFMELVRERLECYGQGMSLDNIGLCR